MPDLINKLSSYAALVGVVGAIGGGFYAWGEFNTRLSAIENKDFVVNETVDLSTVNKEIKDLNEKLNINVQELTSIQNGNFIELLDMQAADHKEAVDLIRSVEAALEALKGDVAINGAAIEFNSAKINELKAANDNPLLN
tara:strand:+ start:448 stop:867 length:420 start_codon:yes stop_codon:yes gene_type:complete